MEDFDAQLAASRTAVERYIRAHVGNGADAEDILQETCLAAFSGYAALRRREAFLPWILGIARRKCMDWYRMRARSREVLLDTMPERAERMHEPSAVEETLEELPEKDRMMLRLFYGECLSSREISRSLQIPEGTVKSRMHAARNRFREAYPCPPRGGEKMQKNELPDTLPRYTIVWKEAPVFPVDCRELPGWFAVPREGEKLRWGMYDLPSRRLDVAYDMEVTGPASVHGLEGVAIRARVLPSRAEVHGDDPVKAAVEASTGGAEEWMFIAQEKDGFVRFLSAEHILKGRRTLTTFLDGDAFMDNWGAGEDNCGMPVRLRSRGLIRRTEGGIVTAQRPGVSDLVGRCEVAWEGRTHDTVCLMDLGMAPEGMISEQYLSREGRTVLWRRFNRDDWRSDRYGGTWSERLPDNERLTVNGEVYVHWYDCLCLPGGA